ncbi:MAG: hypothetical protein HQL41_03385 [Alphaproteobacteria bacterium]|nr:hypothetical protein [Alphaproteobacteria bacterium]
MGRLFVSLTPHGFGHVAMTGPVLAELRRLAPELDVTVQSAAPLRLLEGRLPAPFTLIPDTPDFGMRMRSATEVDPRATFRDYASLHERLDSVIDAEAARIAASGADLVLSNISYVALAAAERVGVPGIGLCCLNWADIFVSCCGQMPGAGRIHAEMLDCYARMRLMLKPRPTMPMPDLPNGREIGPMARRGRDLSAELRSWLGLADGVRLGLVAFGGVEISLPMDRWARLPGWHWIIAGMATPSDRTDMTPFEGLGHAFTDVLASCDVVIGKPGYGTFGEVAVNGRPMLSLPRDDWPETPHLAKWLSSEGRLLFIRPDAPLGDGLERHLQTLLALPEKPWVEPTGAGEAARAILEHMPSGVVGAGRKS